MADFVSTLHGWTTREFERKKVGSNECYSKRSHVFDEWTEDSLLFRHIQFVIFLVFYVVIFLFGGTISVRFSDVARAARTKVDCLLGLHLAFH